MKYFKAFILFWMILFSWEALANPWKNLSSGDQMAQDFLHQMDQKRQEAGAHPFSAGVSQEANLSATELKGRAQHLSTKDPTSQMIFESAETRPQFKIDSRHDPLLVEAERITGTSLEVVGGRGTKVTRMEHVGQDETVECEEAGDESLEKCTRELTVRVIKYKLKKEWSGNFFISKCSVGEKDGHHIPCGALRHAFFTAKNAVRGFGMLALRGPAPLDVNATLNITAAYKSCVREFVPQTIFGCSQCTVALPGLPAPMDQIQAITLLKHPHDAKQLHVKGEHWHTYNSGRHEYWYQPLIKVTYQEESHIVLPDEWTSSCARLEKKVDQGLCSYDSKVCTQGRQTRIIEGVPITRDCWEETYTYSCAYPAKNDCGPLRARGCAQTNSTCKQKVGRTCVVYNQTYQCKGSTTTTESITGGKTPFCLDGNCRDQSWDRNNEMMSTLAQLSLLKEMQGQMREGFLFKGEANRCSKCIVNFKDCCGSGKGWGKSIGLTDCSADERLLREKRNAGLCHYVGTYCAEKIPIIGTCIKKKSTYCCFGSKLLKAFHEQGRPQLGLGWGSAEAPMCRGFTVEEIQRIDFSKLDLREVFEDLIKNFKPGKMEGIGKKIGERLEVIKQGLDPKKKQQSNQRDEA